jgi:AraC family transcriptional activator of mtrCDE
MPINAEYVTKTPERVSYDGDGLSSLLARLKLSARVFLRADFCGDWAVDTSGERRAPFHLVTRGTGWLHKPGAEPLLLTAGDLVLFPRDSEHTLSSSETVSDHAVVNMPSDPDHLVEPVTGLMCGYFSFDERAAAPLLDGLQESIVLHLNDTSRHHETSVLVQLWMNEAAVQAPGCEAAIDQLAYVVFIHLIREQLSRGRVKGPLLALADPRLGPILNRIHADPGAVASVDELAAEALMSRSAFAERFKSVVGLTPGRYLTHWRMQLAADLLLHTDHSMIQISEQCGYQSEVAFRKAFRHNIGISPGKFRVRSK